MGRNDSKRICEQGYVITCLLLCYLIVITLYVNGCLLKSDKNYRDLEHSGKMSVLFAIIEEAEKLNEKIVIFSHYLKPLRNCNLHLSSFLHLFSS